MTYIVFCLFFALIWTTAWALWNQWMLNLVPGEQKRVMDAHRADLLSLFEQQVTDAVKALLLQGSGDKFILQELTSPHTYAIFRNRGARNKQVMRLFFRPDMSVLVAVEWREGGSQHVFTCLEIAGLHTTIVEHAKQYSVFDSQYGGTGTYQRRTDADGLANLAVVHRK